MLESLKHWYTRLNAAQFDNEPIYVTHSEYKALQELEISHLRDEALRCTPLAAPAAALFWGTPVIIDEEKASERKAKWL